MDESETREPETRGLAARLRRDLGVAESYAAMVGMLVGAGIFKVTSDATAATGPSVVLGYLVLAPVILATAIPYCVFASTPLGESPGGDYSHLSRTFGPLAGFLGAWLKVISYLGAAAYLSGALSDYVLELLGRPAASEDDPLRLTLAVAAIVVFYGVHSAGVRWFGRLQVAMCALLGVAIAVLVIPGLFAVQIDNYRPFFTGGATGFVTSLPLLFFAYAGFEALAHSGGELRSSRDRLPRVFLRGVTVTMIVFVSMSAVAFGVLPQEEIESSPAPMAEVARQYLPWGAAAFVTLGAILAVATSLNATLMVPARIGVTLADDGLVPKWLGQVHADRGTPHVGLTLTAALALLLLLSGQKAFALDIAVFALMLLYAIHSAALLWLPRGNPGLCSQITLRLGRRMQVAAAWLSLLTLGGLVLDQALRDASRIADTSLLDRVSAARLTSLELFVLWSAVGVLFYALARRKAA